MNCPRGGLIIQRHNELRDLTALILAEICHDVTTEPVLQPLTGETMQYQTAITTDDARLDIQASGFWGMNLKGRFLMLRSLTPWLSLITTNHYLLYSVNWRDINVDPTIND